MWFDGKNKEQEKKQKTAVAVAYEPGDAASKDFSSGKRRGLQSVSLKRQKKMMYRFIRIIS